ncbi:hypothetical protein CBR_g38645 [Chara braunii]|uniref:Uncharacterized protein n=1 Tax=Chara braunii TaxID=69332 RepID=A0A388K0K4_CHABU|nr:hypothetical protein CBR_g38645 [Chara braunii]|eukprot:GBG63579.1 hypothetical protein CBR_g38645 [Chara braunii]
MPLFINEEVEIVSDVIGLRDTPSVVAFDGRKCLVAEAMSKFGATDPARSIFEVKRLIERPFLDSTLTQVKHFRPWMMAAALTGRTVIRAPGPGVPGKEVWEPEDYFCHAAEGDEERGDFLARCYDHRRCHFCASGLQRQPTASDDGRSEGREKWLGFTIRVRRVLTEASDGVGVEGLRSLGEICEEAGRKRGGTQDDGRSEGVGFSGYRSRCCGMIAGEVDEAPGVRRRRRHCSPRLSVDRAAAHCGNSLSSVDCSSWVCFQLFELLCNT